MDLWYTSGLPLALASWQVSKGSYNPVTVSMTPLLLVCHGLLPRTLITQLQIVHLIVGTLLKWRLCFSSKLKKQFPGDTRTMALAKSALVTRVPATAEIPSCTQPDWKLCTPGRPSYFSNDVHNSPTNKALLLFQAVHVAFKAIDKCM